MSKFEKILYLKSGNINVQASRSNLSYFQSLSLSFFDEAGGFKVKLLSNDRIECVIHGYTFTTRWYYV